MQNRQCRECLQVKPVSEFSKSGTLKGVQYYKSVCKHCALSAGARVRSDLLAQGLVRCTGCKQVLPLSEYYDDKRKKSGKKAVCKACFGQEVADYRNTAAGDGVYRAARARHKKSDTGKKSHREYAKKQRAAGRWYWQERARKFVQDKIRRDGFPKACTHQCADCVAQAEEYHHESYDRERWLDVVPLCVRCHRERHQAKGEHERLSQ